MLARKKSALLGEKLHMTSVGQLAMDRTLADKRTTNIENGLQYHSAIEAKCGSIITYDRKDFHFADIPVMDAEQYLLTEVVGKGRE